MRSSLIQGLICLMLFATLSNCKGGSCAAYESSLSDVDSDCTEDASDNCPLIYNPDQFDGDEDTVGYACDIDDEDDAVAVDYLVQTDRTDFDLSYNVPGFKSTNMSQLADQTEIVFDGGCYFLTCQNDLIGPMADISLYMYQAVTISELIDESLDVPFGVFGYFGRPSAACSAFNPDAPFPPQIVCGDEFSPRGYLTLNPDVAYGVDSCEFMAELGISHPACD